MLFIFGPLAEKKHRIVRIATSGARFFDLYLRIRCSWLPSSLPLTMYGILTSLPSSSLTASVSPPSLWPLTANSFFRGIRWAVSLGVTGATPRAPVLPKVPSTLLQSCRGMLRDVRNRKCLCGRLERAVGCVMAERGGQVWQPDGLLHRCLGDRSHVWGASLCVLESKGSGMPREVQQCFYGCSERGWALWGNFMGAQQSVVVRTTCCFAGALGIFARGA